MKATIVLIADNEAENFGRSKEETRQQVENAGYLVSKVEKYIADLNA